MLVILQHEGARDIKSLVANLKAGMSLQSCVDNLSELGTHILSATIEVKLNDGAEDMATYSLYRIPVFIIAATTVSSATVLYKSLVALDDPMVFVPPLNEF